MCQRLEAESLGDRCSGADGRCCGPEGFTLNGRSRAVDGVVGGLGLGGVLCVVHVVGLGEVARCLSDSSLGASDGLGRVRGDSGGRARGAKVEEPTLLLLRRSRGKTKLQTTGVGEVTRDLTLLPLVGTDCLGRYACSAGDCPRRLCGDVYCWGSSPGLGESSACGSRW